MDTYNPALAFNTLPEDWQRDEEGVWKDRNANAALHPASSRTSGTTLSSLVSPFDPLAGLGQLDLHDDTDASSISYLAAEDNNEADVGESRPTSPGADKTNSRLTTPHLQPLSMTETVAGMGHALLNESRPYRRPTRLEETHDEYGRRFVAHRQQLASGKVFPL